MKALLLALSLLALGFTHDPFSQATFPCMEDEALMFIDTPTKDRTGCVNLEELR